MKDRDEATERVSWVPFCPERIKFLELPRTKKIDQSIVNFFFHFTRLSFLK